MGLPEVSTMNQLDGESPSDEPAFVYRDMLYGHLPDGQAQVFTLAYPLSGRPPAAASLYPMTYEELCQLAQAIRLGGVFDTLGLRIEVPGAEPPIPGALPWFAISFMMRPRDELGRFHPDPSHREELRFKMPMRMWPCTKAQAMTELRRVVSAALEHEISECLMVGAVSRPWDPHSPESYPSPVDDVR